MIQQVTTEECIRYNRRKRDDRARREMLECRGIGMGKSGGPGHGVTGGFNPKAIFGSSLILSVQSDLGITTATGVSGWADQSGNGNHFTQATTSKQPSLATGLRGKPGILFDGSDDELVNTGLVWPAVTSLRLVFRQVTWVTLTAILGPNTTSNDAPMLYTTGGTPNLQIVSPAGSSLNGGATVGTWVRARVLLNNSTTDYLRLGATTVTGSNCGSARTGTGIRLGRCQAYSFNLCSNLEVACLQVLNANPSAGQDAAYDAAVAAFYGPSVAL